MAELDIQIACTWFHRFSHLQFVAEKRGRYSGRCNTCGSGLAREGCVSGKVVSTDTQPSRASPLPQGFCIQFIDRSSPCSRSACAPAQWQAARAEG
ncbi:hypothetical protein EYC95_18680 [Pseudomonas sp. BGI-2]|nr:hypothetical protein EYC95_18680 [Pseudomonas sp. BGI-2]